MTQKTGLALAWLVLGGSFFAGIVSYGARVDGPAPAYVASSALAALAGVVVVCWCTSRRSPAWLMPVLAAGVALPVATLHTLRLGNRHAAMQEELGPLLQYGSVLTPTLHGAASFHLGDGQLVVRSPAGSIGYLEVRSPLVEQPWHGWLLPRALVTADHPAVQEVLSWCASVERDSSYFVLVDADQTLVQLTGWGLLIAVKRRTGAPLEYRVPVTLENASPQSWQLLRDGGRLRLRLNDGDVWSAPDPGPFRYLRIGETQTDGEHGGTLRLTALRLTRTLS